LDLATRSEASSSGYVSGHSALKNKLSICDSRVQDEDDDDSSTASEDSAWDEDEWPSRLPLPLPLWGCERPELKFSSISKYLEFVEIVTRHLKDNIVAHPYDTVSAFVQ